ncbi:tyrosine-protein phosphatase [Nonomuraea sp. NPDC050310]|uniref:tyrosine-protein phosphatase n=1 Tax=unclassified Nonomuraea TaxID=2593643 RepID=UPI0033F79541
MLIASAPNLRDIGGHRTTDGGKVRTGLAYRSGALNLLGPDDQRQLLEAGVRRVCDLRTATERTDGPDLLPEGVDYLVCDVQRSGGHGADIAALFSAPEGAEALSSPESAERFLTEVYRAFVTTTDAHDAYRDLFRALGEPGTLMHCTAGKDRTGWGAAVLLTLLGVDRATVTTDYLASNEHLAASYAGIYDLVPEPEVVRPLLEVRQVYLDAAFDTAAQFYGGVEGYAREALGLAEADLAALRELYLD